MARPIILNGRFLTAPNTGVQRVARELILALDEDLVTPSSSCEWRLAAPSGVEPPPELKAIQFETIPGPPGQLWEQTSFAGLGKSGVLVGLANTAPLSARGGIVMIHDAQVFDAPSSYSAAFRAWYRFMLPRVCRSAANVLTVSRHSAERLKANGVIPSDREADIIPNGVDHILRVAPAPDILAHNGLTKGGFLLGFASDQSHKNTRLLLELAGPAAAIGLDLALVGARLPEGSSPSANVKMISRVGDGELRALYEACFAFLLPSITEGFGLPAGEAMMCAAPVIVSNRAALPEMWGEGAMMADPDRSAEWVYAIQTLKRDAAAWSTLSTRGQRHASAFTWKNAGQRLRQICERAASDSSPTRL